MDQYKMPPRRSFRGLEDTLHYFILTFPQFFFRCAGNSTFRAVQTSANVSATHFKRFVFAKWQEGQPHSSPVWPLSCCIAYWREIHCRYAYANGIKQLFLIS